MAGKSLKVEDAARLLGVKEAAIYKAIDRRSIPGDKEIVNGKTEVSIPAVTFLACIESKKRRLQKRVDHLLSSEQTLRRYIRG